MEFDKLRRLSQNHEVRVDNYPGHKRIPPFYYDSLRHAFTAYFSTFHYQNATYDIYAQGFHDRNLKILEGQTIDDDNTVLAIIGFERFCELFLKDLLKRVNKNLIYQTTLRNEQIQTLITKIELKTFVPKKFVNKPLTISFRETINRFYDLLDIVKSGSSTSKVISKVGRLLKKYSFLDSRNHKATFQLLNWYRDRILHNGNRLPSLWFLDYLITQRLVPIINDIIRAEQKKLGESNYYLTTVTGINILERLNNIHFEFSDLKKSEKANEVFIKLLNIGHLKELGRANLNMNIFVRNNIQAGFEYNYKDPIGRGKRFAEAERNGLDKNGHPDFKDIKDCVCCGEKSMVVYRHTIDDIFNPTKKLNIEWIKCYTCDYHLRFNVGDPKYFNLNSEAIFEEHKI